MLYNSWHLWGHDVEAHNKLDTLLHIMCIIHILACVVLMHCVLLIVCAELRS